MREIKSCFDYFFIEDLIIIKFTTKKLSKVNNCIVYFK